MRKALVKVLDRAIEVGQTVQADKRAGQMALFGGSDAGEPPPDPVIGTEEWTEAEMLAHEKATLGFYVTSHPLAQHVPMLQRFATTQVCDLAGCPENSEVTIAGMITKMRTVTTRSGRNAGSRMGIVTIEDLSGAVEVVVFARDLEKFRPLIAPERVVFVTGRVDRKREDPSLRVSEMFDLAEAPARLAGSVLVCFRHAPATREKLDRLRALADTHAGDTPLFLELVTPQRMRVTIRCQKLAVSATPEFVGAVEELLGSGSVHVLPPAGAVGRVAASAPRRPPTRPTEQPQSVGAH
jgi:DNA polymerase-3 subunit alpha